MKLLELECKNCGATLKIDENTENISCPYCKAIYKIDDEVKHIKYDDMENSGYEFEKGRIKAQEEHLENNNILSKTKVLIFIIPFIIFTIFIVSFIGISMSSSKRLINTSYSEDSKENKIEDEFKQRELETERNMFNMDYSNGRKAEIFVQTMLERSITNNKTNKDRKITVVYNDITTQDPEQILEIQKQLIQFKEYDVMLDYDEDGFVSGITIK